jgi:hypothetical protein
VASAAIRLMGTDAPITLFLLTTTVVHYSLWKVFFLYNAGVTGSIPSTAHLSKGLVSRAFLDRMYVREGHLLAPRSPLVPHADQGTVPPLLPVERSGARLAWEEETNFGVGEW